MIWIFFILAAAAIALVSLGALSVWVVGLSIALKAMLIVPVVLVLLALWQSFYGRKS